MRIILVVVIILYSFTGIVFAQQYNFTNYSIEQGLLQSQVNAMLEDSKGYLWIGTNGGLSRFDGIKFTNYTSENGLSDNHVKAICEDNHNNIWVGTSEGSVCMFDGEKFTKYGSANGLQSVSVNAIAKNNTGDLFFGTEKKGLFVFKDERFVKVIFTTDKPDITIKALLVDQSGKLWIGTNELGVYVYAEGKTKHYTAENGLCNNKINAIYNDLFKNIWIATGNGVYKYKDNNFTKYDKTNGISSNNITSVVTEKKGNIWFGTSDAGVSKFTGKEYIYYNNTNGLDNDNVTTILVDRTMNIWIGTEKSGIFKYDGDRFVHFTAKDGLPSNIVMSIMEDSKKNLWFGTYGDGVCRYDGKKFTYFTTKDGLCSNVIYSMLQDNKGNIWFGSKGSGASMYDGKRFVTYNTENGLSSNMIYSIMQDVNGYLFLGTLGGGLNIFDGKKFTVISKKEGLSSNLIYFVFQDKKGNIFIGTQDKGVDMIFNTCTAQQIVENKKIGENNIMNISKKFGLSNEQVLSITQDQEENIWFGTYGGGICKFDGKFIKAYTQKDGLNSNNIFFLLTDSKGYIWAGSEKGINRIFLTNRKQPLVKTYSKDEGYRGIESTLNGAIEDHNGYLWFATVKGVSRYDALADLPSSIEPNIRICGIKIFSETINWASYSEGGNDYKIPQELTLPHDKNHITFDFIGIDLKSPDKVKYQWILEGYDKTWSPITAQQISAIYTYIPNGEYTFKVRSCNNDGVWNKLPAMMKLIVKPPFWLTWWFISICIIFISATLFFFVKARYRYLKKANRQLEEKVQIRTALLNQEKQVVENQAHLLQDQKHKLEEINKELEKLSIVASETGNSVMIADSECRIQWVNEGFHKLYGYDKEDFKLLFGQHITFTSNFKDIGKILNECFNEKKSVVYDAESKTKDGKRIWIQTTLTPIYTKEGNLKQLVAIDTDITKIKQAEEQIKKEKEKSDNLLLNILPIETAEELKSKGFAEPRSYKRVSVMFTDFKGFTKACEKLNPKEIVTQLHEYFVKFDDITEQYFLEKIKTIGDSYMCVGGLPIRNKSHPFDSVLAALQIQNFMNEDYIQRLREDKPTWELRLGIHTGEVVAGVVGRKKFAYDIWGDTVNIASRMESSGAVGMVNISGTTYEFIKDYFICQHRGKIEAKNKGAIDMYFVAGIKPEYAKDPKGIQPNEKFNEFLREL